MKVVMVKHTPRGKVYWFEVPEKFAGSISPGDRVGCDTCRGTKTGIVIGSVMDDSDVIGVMVASGATLPLREIVAVKRSIPISSITIPNCFVRTKPSDEKLAKRFLELYNTGRFHTDVIVSDNGVLKDGYSAYLVAKFVGAKRISAITNYNPGGAVCLAY